MVWNQTLGNLLKSVILFSQQIFNVSDITDRAVSGAGFLTAEQ
jgi:hypothetical protein